jgi:cytochrome c-type biogenesis protein
LPVSYGVGAIARAVPWAGFATGAALAFAGLLTLLGRHLRLPTQPRVRARRERRLGAMLLFGIGYGAASLGCTLPLFLLTWLAVFAIALASLAAGCSAGKNAAPPQPTSMSAAQSTTSGVPGPRQLTDLRDIGQLRSQFNTRSGAPRLILLVSPT